MNYLFICSLGPVQDFIASARRSRDLWYGSWILSELAKTAALALGKNNLIFPSNNVDIEPNSSLSFSNKIIARIETKDPEEIGKKVEEAVRNRLEELFNKVLKQIENKGGKLETSELAKKQVNDLLEFYWSAVPFPNEEDYSKVRVRAEALLSARKATRNFKQMKGNAQFKSSLDGNRESVIPEEAYPKNKRDEEGQARNLYRKYSARPSERLSGVDLLKRLGEVKAKQKKLSAFPSTSHFASLPFRKMLENKMPGGKVDEFYKEIRNAYTDHISDNDFPKKDGALLYESRIAEFVSGEKEKESLRKKIVEIYQYHNVDKRPSPYYALLRADGDNMGKIIDNQKTIGKHRELSETLSRFALKAQDIIKGHEGRAIYTGGDDILAYLPLHTVLDCAEKLDTVFQEKMGAFQDKDGFKPSLSASIVIAHHLDPLSDVMRLSREKEKIAKDVPDKNGLTILSSKRSGGDRVIVGKRFELLSRLKEMIKFHRGSAISKGTAYELQKLEQTLAGANLPSEAIQKEALRIIKRKCESGTDKKISQEVLDTFENWIEKEILPIDALAVEMIIANIFASALTTAQEKKQ